MVSLEEAISSYETAIQNIASGDSDDHQSQALSLFTARDTIAQILFQNPSPTPEALGRISKLDENLNEQAARIKATVGPSTLSSWRETVRPPADAWWWHLDKPSPLWALSASLLIIITFGLLLEIALRFLSAGANFLNASEVLVGLLVGSAIVKIGRREVTRTLSRLGIRPEFQHVWTTVLALVFFLAVFTLRLSLPSIARSYNDEGVNLQGAKKLSSAVGNFRRAISLNSEYPQAHYNLATAYEDLLDYDGAISEYRQAIGYDERFYAAYNNLARLHILRHNDYTRALKLLDTALALSEEIGNEPERNLIQYAILKNRGWAYFGLKLFKLAKDDLGRARELDPEGPAAHCLLAQVLEAQNNQEAAMEMWRICEAKAPVRGYEVEADWLGIAQERLQQGGMK